MNPHYGDFDTYHMAASAIDEAMRNAVAVGMDPAKIAISTTSAGVTPTVRRHSPAGSSRHRMPGYGNHTGNPIRQWQRQPEQ